MSSLLTRRAFLGASLFGGSSFLLARAFSRAPTASSQSTPEPMASAGQAYAVKAYTPKHSSWPYSERDFTRNDSSPDDQFYSSPRYVTHIDDAAISSLREYYASVLPRQGRILDLCSSWISHYPPTIEEAAAQGQLKITGMGMSEPELARNAVLNGGRIVWDLNEQPSIPDETLSHDAAGPLDAITCVVSIDYLTQPVEVLSSLRARTRDQGSVHLVVSNRCFPTKAMRAWMHADEDERLQMVGDYLHFSGWRDIEIVTLSDGTVDSQTRSVPAALAAILGQVGGFGRDPLWVVRAKNTSGGSSAL